MTAIISFPIKQKNNMNSLVHLSPQDASVQQVSEVCVKLQPNLQCRVPIIESYWVKENFLVKGNSLLWYISWIFASAFLPRVSMNQEWVGKNHSRSGRIRKVIVVCCACHWRRALAECLEVPHNTFRAISIKCVCAWSPRQLDSGWPWFKSCVTAFIQHQSWALSLRRVH